MSDKKQKKPITKASALKQAEMSVEVPVKKPVVPPVVPVVQIEIVRVEPPVMDPNQAYDLKLIEALEEERRKLAY